MSSREGTQSLRGALSWLGQETGWLPQMPAPQLCVRSRGRAAPRRAVCCRNKAAWHSGIIKCHLGEVGEETQEDSRDSKARQGGGSYQRA